MDFIFKKRGLLACGIFLFTSVISIVITYPITSNHSYYGGHDFSPPLYIRSLSSELTVIDTINNNGINTSYILALFFPFRFHYYLLNIFGINSLLSTGILFMLITFFSQYNAYLLSTYLQRKLYKEENFLIALVIGIFYFFCPIVVSLLLPGHVSQLFIFTLLPLIMLFFDKYLSSDRLIDKNLIYIIFLSLFSASSFYNLAVYFSFLLLLILYAFLIFLNNKNFLFVLSKTFIVCVSSLISNLWWLLPFLLNVVDFHDLNYQSYLNDFLSLATDSAKFIFIFSGIPDPRFHHAGGPYSIPYYSSIFYIVASLLLFIFVLCKIFTNKKSYVLKIFLIMMIFAFLTKGNRPPFGGFFKYAYDNIFGFKMFRRPVSKFYPVYWLLYTTLLSLVYSEIVRRSKIVFKLFSISLLIFLVLLNFVFFNRKPESMFTLTVPDYYKEPSNYLMNDGVSTVMILPSAGGLFPVMTKEFNNYSGMDILIENWNIPLLYPDLSGYSHDMSHKEVIKSIYIDISKERDVCNMTKDIGLTHIIWRDDVIVDKNYNLEGDFKKLLIENKAINDVKIFGKIYVYRLKEKCRGSLIHGEDHSGNTSNIIKPIMYGSHYFTFYKPEGIDVVKFNKNRDSNWRLIKVDERLAKSKFFTTLAGVFNKGVPSNKGGYYNEWLVNNNGDYYIIYYFSQKFVYFGFITFLLYVISILLIYRERKYKKEC